MIHGRADCRAQPLGNAPADRRASAGSVKEMTAVAIRGASVMREADGVPVARVTARPRACCVLDSDWWGTASAACLAMEHVRLPREAVCASGAGAFVRPDLLLPHRRHGFGTGGLWGLPT